MNDPILSQQSDNESSWSTIAGTPVSQAEALTGGGNSRVFKLACRDGRTLVGKQYFQHPEDDRDRMKVELSALNLLQEHGIECIPRIVSSDHETSIAVYEFIEGEVIHQPGSEDIDQAIEFLGRLKEISARISPDTLQPASEAFFSGDEVMGNIRERLARLDSVPADSPLKNELEVFLRKSLHPALEFFSGQLLALYEQGNIRHDQKIAQEDRTLSPSDFGFHNALRRPNGAICFLDFEYFGWDDPVKTLCDFIIHPHQLMNINQELQKQFIEKFMAVLNPPSLFKARAKALYPLFRLKWCLIILNEFIPAEQARRRFSGASPEDENRKLQTQLDKAEKILKETTEEHERFCRIMA